MPGETVYRRLGEMKIGCLPGVGVDSTSFIRQMGEDPDFLRWQEGSQTMSNFERVMTDARFVAAERDSIYTDFHLRVVVYMLKLEMILIER
jgi:hypothetical protein